MEQLDRKAIEIRVHAHAMNENAARSLLWNS
jgi:hypothetical protein